MITMIPCATFAVFLYFFFGIVCGHTPVPRPIITLHGGHIGLYERLLETQFNGVIETGEPYTLDIYMGNTDEYDYIIENCVFNQRLSFMDNYGCLRKTAFFVDQLETNEYSRQGAVKRTLIHFFADQPILNFECHVKVVHCSGCLEQSCERRPLYDSYPFWNMPLQCCGNYPPPYIPPPAPIPPGPIPQPIPQQDWWHRDWIWGLPWWAWLLIFLALLLLLCCLCALIACCFMKGRGKRRDSRYSDRTYSPPPAVPQSRIYTVDGAVQTLPEQRQASQQVDMHESYTRTNYFTQPQQEYAYNLRQVDNHATIDLHPETNHTSRRPNSAAAYTNHVYDGDFYEEDLHERAFTKYESHKAPKHSRATPLTHTVPIRRTSSSHTSQEERRLQRELEEQLRHRSNYHDGNDEFIERIEEQLRSQHYHQQQRNVEPEAFREETIRTMHQSSVI